MSNIFENCRYGNVSYLQIGFGTSWECLLKNRGTLALGWESLGSHELVTVWSTEFSDCPLYNSRNRVESVTIEKSDLDSSTGFVMGSEFVSNNCNLLLQTKTINYMFYPWLCFIFFEDFSTIFLVLSPRLKYFIPINIL